MDYRFFKFSMTVLALSVGTVLSAAAQTPDEHAKHHPAPSTGAAAPAMAGPAAGGMPMPAAAAPGDAGKGGVAAPAAGMGGGMGEMMGAMMAPKSPCVGGDCGSGAAQTPIYPSLMTLPALTPEKRAELDAMASQQTTEGMARLSKGIEALDVATRSGDEAAKQQAVGLMHEALNELEAGVAARRVLTEGKAPRNLALDWFKREMNLASPVVRDESRGFLGLTAMHLFTMALLVAFAFAMLAMYYFKMRRAAALFGRLDPDAGSPPPGSSPPAGGGPPPSGGSPPPPSSPKADEALRPVSPTPRSTGAASSPASTPSPAAPVNAKWVGPLRVESIVSETPVVKTYRLRSTTGGALPFTFVPGQFLNLAFGIGGARMNRSYSISSSPTARDYVELSIKREERGAVSRHILDLVKVGDDIEAGGPVGKFTFTGTESDSIVLISAGVGITPFLSITRYLTEQSWPGDIFFFYQCRKPVDFIFERALDDLQIRNPKLRVVVVMSKPDPDWKGPRGHLTKELLIQSVPNLASRRIHICGPPAMMEETKAMLLEIGVSPDQLKSEQFGAVKPLPGAPGSSAKPTAPATGPVVTFSTNAKSAKIHTGQTILELSEELGIGIEFSCRVGTCGVCKVKLIAGDVDMEVQDALDDDDKKNGIILACQAKPKAEVTVEA